MEKGAAFTSAYPARQPMGAHGRLRVSAAGVDAFRHYHAPPAPVTQKNRYRLYNIYGIKHLIYPNLDDSLNQQ